MSNGRRSSRLSEFVHGRLSPEEALQLLAVIETDPKLSEALEEQISLAAFAASKAGVQVLCSLRVNDAVPYRRRARFLAQQLLRSLRLHRFAYFTSFVIVLIAMWGVTFDMALWRSTNNIACILECRGIMLRLRSHSDTDLSAAATLLAEGEFAKSAEHLERISRVNANDELSLWAKHLAGVIRISGSRHSILGLWNWVDASQVRLGIGHLEKVEGHLGIPQVEEEGRWYQGIGWLMLGDQSRARLLLEKVSRMSGSHANEADSLLREMKSDTSKQGRDFMPNGFSD